MTNTLKNSVQQGSAASANIINITSVSPAATGDVLVVSCTISPPTQTLSSIQHSGVTTWNLLTSETDGATEITYLYWGVVTATGSSTLSINFTGNVTAARAMVAEYQSSFQGTGGAWSVDKSAVETQGSVAGTYPSVTASAYDKDPLYVGAAGYANGSAMAGGTSGFVYTTDVNHHLEFIYKLAPGSGALAPAWSAAGNTNTLSVVAGILYYTYPTTSDNLAATWTGAFSPEGIGEAMHLSASWSTAFTPEGIGEAMHLVASWTIGVALALHLPTAGLSGLWTAAFAPEGIGPMGLLESWTGAFSPEGIGENAINLSAAWSGSFSPEGIGEAMHLSASWSTAFTPEGIGEAMHLVASWTIGVALALHLPTAGLSGLWTAAFAPEGIGVPMGLLESWSASYSPEAIGEAMALAAVWSAGFSPEAIGEAMALLASWSAALSIHYPFASQLLAKWTAAVVHSLFHASGISRQAGYQYVHDIPSTALENNTRIYTAVGVPSAHLGNNGDFYRRKDGVVGTNSLYLRSSGSWSAIG